MSTKRQNNQLELAFGSGGTGEARSPATEGTEVDAAAPRHESPAVPGPFMEAIVERDNLRKALAATPCEQARMGTPAQVVNGGVNSGHRAAQKSATSGLGVTRATRRRRGGSAVQIAGG